MPAPSLFDQLREQSRPSFEPEPLDTGRIVKDVDTRLAKESADYAKGQEQAAKDAAKQQVQGLKEKGYTVVHDEAGNPAPLTAANGEPVRRKAGSRIHVGEQTGEFYEPDLQKGGLKPASGQKKTDKNGRIIEDFGGGLIKDLGEDPAWAKRKEDKTLLTKAEAAIRDKMLAPPPEGMDVVKTKKDYFAAQKALAKAEKNLEDDKTDKDYLAAHAKAKADLDAIAPQNEAINQWSKSKTGLHRQLAQIKTHRELLGEGAFTDENRKHWQSVIAPPAAPAPAQVAPATPAPATVTPPAPTAGTSGQAALQASKEPMSESPTAAPATTGTVATPTRTQAPSPAVSPVQGQGTVAAPAVQSAVGVPSPQPITPAPREQLVTPEAVADLSVADHNTAIQASDAALKQNAAAIQQKQDAINAPVAAVDAKLSAWQAKSQAALAAGDAAISMRQLNGEMSPLFAASTKKELQDLYEERQKAQADIAPAMEEIDSEWAAHQEDVDAHNRAIENLNGKIESAKAEQETKRQESLKALRSQPETAPIADKIDALDKETESARAQIDAKEWDDSSKEAALGALEADREAKMKDINKVLNRGSIMGLAQRIYANTTDAEKKKQAERSSLKNYDSEGGYSGPSEKELADTYDSPVNAKVASALNHAGLSSDEIKPYLEDVKNLDFGRNQKESALLSDGNLVVNPKNYLREDDYKTAVEASGATEEQKKAALDRFPKLQQKAAADLYSSIQETDPALLKREVDVMPGETDADKMTAYMNRGYLPRLWTQIRAELGANISGLQKGVLGIAAAVAGATDKGYKALGLPDLATGEVSDYLHEKALGFAKDQQSDSQVAGLMNTGKVGGALSAVAGFVPDLVAMGAVGKVAQSVRFLTGVGSETIAGIDAATAATRAAAATGDVKKGMEAYGQLLKAQGVTADALGEKLATLKSKLASFGGKPLPGDVLSVMEELGGKKLSGLVAKEAGTGANAAAAYFAGKGGGETYVDAYDKTFRTLTEKGVNPDAAKSQAQASALVPALVNGAITYALFKNKSLGDITDNALETEAMLKRTMSDVLKSIGQHAAIDAGKLGLDTLAHGIVAKATYDPEKSPASILEESLQSALTGALMGGVIRAVHEFAIRKSGGKAAGEKPTDTEPQSPNPDVPPNLPGGLPVEVKTAASDAELKANPNGGDPEKATVLRDIATGADVATMTEGELNAVGLTHKGDKVVPITGKDAPTPAVQVTGDGKAIILQPALDELRATFPATAEFVTMDEKQAREKFAQNGNADTSPIEPSVENAAPPTAEVAPEPRVEPTPSGEVAAKPVVPNPAAVAKGADIAATLGKQSATKIQEKLSPLHPKVTKVIDGMISAYGQRGVSIAKGTTDGPSGIEFDPDSKKIVLNLAKIHANTEGSTPNDVIAWVKDSVARHELVHLVSTTDKTVSGHLDNLWSQLSDEDKSASAKTYYKGARSKWDSDFRGKHEFLVQLVQAAEDGKLEPALLKILKGKSKSLFDTLRQLMDALIARLQRILTDPKHKAHEAAKKTLEAFKAARARLFAEPVGKVDTTSGLTDKGETEGDLTTGLARKTTNPAEGGQSKSGIGNRPVASNESPDASSFASGVASKVADSGDVATVDVKAHEAAASPHNDLTPPTPAQIEADNYKVGKVRLAGEDISIETPAGAKRREEWPALKDHYGRILGTKGADGELLDIFIKEGTPLDWNGPVFVVNQNKPDGTFDETKAIAGAKSVAEAREIYKRNYSKGWKGLGGIVKYDSLKDWVESDHSGKAKVTTGEEETRAKIAELRAESSRLRKEAADYNASTNGRAVANKGRNNIHETNSGSGISTFRAPSLENSESAKHRELINKANEALKKAKKLEATLPKAAPKDVTSVRIQKVVTKRDPGSANIYSVTNLAPDVLKALGFDRVWIIPGQPQQVFADPADGGPRVKLFDGDVSKELIPFLNARLDVKPVNVKTGGMEIIPPPPIPQPTAEVGQPPAPPIPDLPSPYLASLVAKDAAHKILLDHVKQIFGEGAGARADGSKPNASEQEALDGIKKHAASQGWKWPDVQEVARKQNGLNSDFMEDNSHEARMLKSYRDTLAKAKDQATKSDALNAEAQAKLDAKNAEVKRLADEKAEAERKTREDERAAETERKLKFHDESVAKLPPVFVEKWKQDMSKKDRKALLNAIMLKTDNRNEPELVAALDRAPLPPAPPKPETETAPPQLVAETLRASRDTLFDLPPRKRSLSGMRDAVRRKLEEIENYNDDTDGDKIDRAEKDARRLRTLLGKIETAMSGIKDTSEAQREEQRRFIGSRLEEIKDEAEKRREISLKKDAEAAKADGWEVKRFEEKSSKRGGRPFTGWEVTHNGQRVKYGFSTKGEADERMVQLHKASVTRPKPTAEQNQTTREELKAKGATSVVKAAEPEKAPELMTPSEYKAAGLGPANDVVALEAARQRKPINAEIVDQYGLKYSLPKGYVRDGDVYRYEEPKGYDMGAASRRNEANFKEAVKKAGDADAIEMTSKLHSGIRVIITREPSSPYKWRATRIDDKGPSGHNVYDSKELAISDYTGGHITNGPAWGTDYKVSEVRSKSSSTGQFKAQQPQDIIDLLEKHDAKHAQSENYVTSFEDAGFTREEISKLKKAGMAKQEYKGKTVPSISAAAELAHSRGKPFWPGEHPTSNEQPSNPPTSSPTPAEGQSTASNSWEIPEKDAAEMRRLLKQKKTALLAGDGERVDSLEDKIDALKAKNPNPNVSKDTPTPATTPAEGQSTGGVVEGEKEGSEAAPTEPALMTPEQLAAYEKAKALQNATEALARAKSGEDKPNVFINGAKSKAELVRMRTADVNDAISGSFGDIWNTMLDAAREKKPIAVHLLDGLSKTRPETEPLHAQAERNLFENGYVKEGALYVHKDSPVITTPAVDAYGLKLPEGYVRDGDVYRYEKPSDEPAKPQDEVGWNVKLAYLDNPAGPHKGTHTIWQIEKPEKGSLTRGPWGRARIVSATKIKGEKSEPSVNWKTLFDAEKITARQAITIRDLGEAVTNLKQENRSGETQTVITLSTGEQKLVASDGSLSGFSPASNEQPTNPPTPATTPAEGQSAGGVVEGEKAPTAQEWKALYEEHQALLAASKDNPQAWKPQEWQAHRSALMKREANSRKVPAVWSHNELITATGKYELDHETGELTKLQPLSEIGFLRNVDSLFKDSIPESGIDGGNDLARKLWAKVKAERAEGEQRKADAAAKAQAESKVKAEEQAKLDATATERRAAFVATIGTPKFKAVKYTDLAGNVFGGQQLGNWVIYKPKGSSNYSIVDEPSKMGVNGLLQDRNVSQADAREIAAWLNRANEGFSGELAKNTDQLGKLRATLTAWRDGGAPAWFKGKAEAPESVKPDEITSSDLPQVGDRVSWIDDSGHKAVSTIERISDGKGRVDHFGMKFVDMSRFTLEKKSTARLKREGIVETPATPKETDKPPASSDVVKSPKLQSPNSDEYWSYNTLVKWMTDNGIPVDMTREEYEGEVARRKGIIEPPVHDTTQAGTAQMREQGGYEEYIKNEPRSFREKVWPEALQIVSKEPFKGTELVKELLDSPRALEDTERAILTHESLRRQKAYDKSIDDLIAAKPEDYAAAEKKMMAAREAHQEGLEALDMAGSKAGSALGAIRLMIKNDFSLGRLERRFRAALGPKPTPEEIKEADAKAAELAKVIKENDELTEQIRSQLDEIAGLKAAMKAHEHGLTPKADRKAEIKEEDDALARLKSRRKLSSGDVLASPSPEDDDFNDLAIFGRRFIRDGASDLTSFTTAFNAAIPGALGDNASAVYEAAKVKFKEAEDAALKDSTPTGVTNKLKVKRAEIADLKASDLNNLAMAIVQHETVKDVDTLRAKMHERLEEIFPHITEKDVSKAWTGFEKAVYPSSDPFRKLVSDLRAQEQLILKVQTLLEEERLALKSGRQPPPRTDAQRKLIREYNDLVKASGLTTSDPEKQLASNQSRIINALRNRKADLEAQVDAKKRESRANVTTPETPEMKRLRDEIAALNAKLDILDPRNTGPTEAQKIKMAESGLKKSLDNVNKEIAELERKIKTNDLSEPAPATKTSVTSPAIAQRRKELAAKREQRDDLANQLDDLREAAKPVVDPLMKVLGKWEERQNLATVKAPPRTKSRLEELSKRYLDSESPRFVQDAVALGMSLGDAEDAKLILDAERNRREEIALASMRRRVRRNIERQVARAQAFDEDSPLARKTPAEKKLDKDLTEAEFQLSLAKREALRAEEKFRLRNRTLLRKAADSAVKWRRALILADYVVLYKLGMAAGWRMAFTPTEEAIGTAISKALPGLSKNAPREFGGSVRAEAEALTQGFRYLVENFGKVLKHGVSSMDTKYSSKPDFNDLDPSLSDYIGNSHAAIKLLPKASEFYRSFRKRTEAALRNGIDATSPAAVQAIGAAAYLDAQRAIFMNPNFVSEGWRAIIGKLRKTETSPNWAKVTADVMEAAIPIVKVPTNILFEALGSYIGGILRETPFALKSAAKAATTFDGQGFAKRFNDEYSKLPPEQAEAVLRHLKKGAFGNALMLLVMLTGATASKLIGGLWTPDDKREPWQVKPERFRLSENGKDLHRAIAHNPVFDTLHFAVTAYHYAEKAANASKAIAAKAEVEIAEAEHRMKKANGSSKDFIKAKRERDVAQKKLEAARAGGDPNKLAWAMATLSGMTTSTLALVEKAPLIGNVGQFLDAIPEDKKGDYLKKELAASVIPTGVTNIAKGEDEGPDGEPIKRKMESFSDHLKNRIPGLRQTLPFKNGETDEFGFKRSETHVPIPGEKAIENFNKKNPDVKYHIPKISQASLDDLRNEVAKTAFQIRAGELLRKYSKEGIVKSEVVNDGSREEPNFVIKKTVEIPPITKEESENPTLKTIEKLKSMHRKAVTTAKSDAERPDWPLSYLDKYRSSVTK